MQYQRRNARRAVHSGVEHCVGIYSHERARHSRRRYKDLSVEPVYLSAYGAPEQVRPLRSDESGCLCGTVSARSEGRAHPRVPADLSYSVDSYPLYFLDDFRALRFVEEYKCYNFRRVNRYNRIGVSDFRLLWAHFAQDGRAL